MTATNEVLFSFVPSGTGTKVIWTMNGHNGFLGKAFSMVMNMDKLVGGDFDRGLAQLKSVAESSAPPAASAGSP
jgi:hypothetical protein